jgi:hypothetical protein
MGFTSQTGPKADLIRGKVPYEQLPVIELAATRVSYQELSNRALSYQLKAGNWYLITDWQLTHIIANTSVLHTAPVEPILVLATETYALSPIAYSTVYRQDILYYTIDNADPRLPGATKGIVYRRIDTKCANDIQLDFRNVVFRRWYNPATGYYTVCTNNGSYYQDVSPFGGYQDNIIFGNTWSGYDPRRSIFNYLNFVAGYEGRFRNNELLTTSLLNVTIIGEGYVRGLLAANSIIDGFVLKRVAFMTLFGGVLNGSTISNRYQEDGQAGWTLINSAISNEQMGAVTYLVSNRQVAYV